jgi:hypothetical protein
MLQVTLVILAGLGALLTGSIANYINYGFVAVALYAAILITAVYAIIYQIRCVVRGSCFTTAWWNSGVAVVTFATIGWYYYAALSNGATLVTLDAQPVIGTNPTFAGAIKKVVGKVVSASHALSNGGFSSSSISASASAAVV